MHLMRAIKRAVKNAPIIGRVVEKVYRRFVPGPEVYVYNRIRWEASQADIVEKGMQQIVNLLNYSKTSGASFAAMKYPAGYHTIRIGGSTLQGQRDPLERLNRLKINFSGLRVIDIGCNQGGMLFALHDKIKWGVGVDFDYRLVNCCSRIAQHTGMSSRLDFYCFDIDKDPHEMLLDMLPEPTGNIDAVFLLAVCMWVEKWKEIIDHCAEIAPTMVFESNGDDEFQKRQIEHVMSRYEQVEMIDDPSNGNRQLMIARNSG